MKKFFSQLFVLLFLVFFIPFVAAQDCTIKPSCLASEFAVFSVPSTTNAHASTAVSGAGSYSNKVCCPSSEFSGNSCSDPNKDVALNLYNAMNSHVEQDGLGNYTNPVCLTAATQVTCWYTSDDCSVADGVGVASIWDGLWETGDAIQITNAHVEQYNGSGNYPINVCCSASAPSNDVCGDGTVSGTEVCDPAQTPAEIAAICGAGNVCVPAGLATECTCNAPPIVQIIAPPDGASYDIDDDMPVLFEGTVSDMDDGTIFNRFNPPPLGRVVWQSSLETVDGGFFGWDALWFERQLTKVGTHTITLYYTDSEAAQASTTVDITVSQCSDGAVTGDEECDIGGISGAPAVACTNPVQTCNLDCECVSGPATPTCNLSVSDNTVGPGDSVTVDVSLDDFSTNPTTFGSVSCGDAASYEADFSCTGNNCSFSCGPYSANGTIENLQLNDGVTTVTCSGAVDISVGSPSVPSCSIYAIPTTVASGGNVLVTFIYYDFSATPSFLGIDCGNGATPSSFNCAPTCYLTCDSYSTNGTIENAVLSDGGTSVNCANSYNITVSGGPGPGPAGDIWGVKLLASDDYNSSSNFRVMVSITNFSTAQKDADITVQLVDHLSGLPLSPAITATKTMLVAGNSSTLDVEFIEADFSSPILPRNYRVVASVPAYNDGITIETVIGNNTDSKVVVVGEAKAVAISELPLELVAVIALVVLSILGGAVPAKKN